MSFYNDSLTILAGLSNGFDGLVIRGNTPYLLPVLEKNEEKNQKRRLEAPNPESDGNYQGYIIGGDQSKISYS
jgi:hypothetical protein